MNYLVILLLIIIILCLFINNKESFENNNFKNVIMTTYFCKKKDPQRNTYAPCNDIKYIKPWYYSIKKLGLNGIIFHDGMSKEFINKYQTDKIKFVYVNSNKYDYSLNDLRFFVYYDYILNNNNIENVFMTDGNDVTVVQNPFKDCNTIMVGHDANGNGTQTYLNFKNNTIKKWLNHFNNNNWKYKIDYIKNKKCYNAGILGGNRQDIIKFLKNMVIIFKQMNSSQKTKDLNIIVFNYVIYTIFNNNVKSGSPICSRFKKYENNRKDVYFIHK